MKICGYCRSENDVLASVCRACTREIDDPEFDATLLAIALYVGWRGILAFILFMTLVIGSIAYFG